MPSYSDEFKEKVVQKMMPPDPVSVAKIHAETNVSIAALYSWRNEYQNKGIAVPADSSNPEKWRGADKLSVVIETAPLNEQALSEYCRKKGIYREQIERWKEAAIAGNETNLRGKAEQGRLQQERKQYRQLEKELQRKEKALAEAAALLILQKKAQAIWGDNRED